MSFLPSPGSSADDRETPLVAVEDILPVLLAAADASRKLLSDISIYDPYYCRGAVKSHLISLGCSPGGVHNDPIDCYTAQKANEVPAFDVLLSNPPYSGDHIQRCVHYAVASSKPWALLLPSNVFLRPWFEKAVKDQTVWFLAPHERYGFLNDSARNSAAENHVPFVTMWFIGGLNISSRGVLRDRWLQSSRNTASTLAVSPLELPRRIKKLLPFTKNRANKARHTKEKEERKQVTKRKHIGVADKSNIDAKANSCCSSAAINGNNGKRMKKTEELLAH